MTPPKDMKRLVDYTVKRIPDFAKLSNEERQMALNEFYRKEDFRPGTERWLSKKLPGIATTEGNFLTSKPVLRYGKERKETYMRGNVMCKDGKMRNVILWKGTEKP